MAQALELAFKFHQEGRLAEAERLYRDVLQARPRDFEALHMLGILKLQQGQADEAASLIGTAIEVDRRSVAALSNYGLALAALGRFEEALASYDRALAITPRNADALRNRGDALYDLGRREEALASYDKAVAVSPRHVGALVNRGLLLRDLGRPAEALSSYDKALACDPNDYEAWNNRGIVLQDFERHGEALVSFERALALWPDYVDALMNRGNALLTLRRPADAIASYSRALVLKPDLADAHDFRGHALVDLGRQEEALASYDRAIAANPDHVDALINRARLLCKLDRHRESLAEYERLRTRFPDLPLLANDSASAQMASCSWAAMPQLGKDLIAKAVSGACPVDPFLLLCLDSSHEQQLACARHSLAWKKIAGVERTWNAGDFQNERLRIAYLSADYHRHATANLIAELFEVHDRARFEVIGLSFGPDDKSPMRARLVKSFDRFFDVTARINGDVAALLRDLKVNIAVDLKGHTTDARMGIFAQRAAPIQVSYLGYPGTSGADFIDYLVADPFVLPLDQQAFFSEKIVHLPDSYQVNDRKRPVGSVPSRSELGLPDDAFVFCCFNNAWKINPRMFDIWMRLLGRVERSILWLYQGDELAVANLRREAGARGIDPARLIFAPLVDVADHLARLVQADLVLDTLPYNAHTTASDALWVGVPLVTCTGTTFAGRVATSLLHAAGLPELATVSLDDYEMLAFKLAADPSLLSSVRRKLADSRSVCALFDTDRFRRHLEAAYQTMWEIWRRGESPRSFSVAPEK